MQRGFNQAISKERTSNRNQEAICLLKYCPYILICPQIGFSEIKGI